ncbi:MAG: aa3-type cytochrome c oxidase subunit IV [Alphaproteobacteria bacterium]|nr:aa3-type cytochrome c oxidase subunit IV [Alphaproteobacteria bacterium]
MANMDTQEQVKTYDGFIKATVRSTIAIVIVMALLAAFVA